MYILTNEEELLGKEIVDSAYQVHSNIGPGLLEKVYEVCFCYDMNSKGILVQRQVKTPVSYKGIIIDEGLQVDVLVAGKIICELKAVDKINPVWQAQVLSQLKMTGNHVGYLINFNVPLIKNGIRRYCR